ncbi:hypothetical protein AB0877_21490 [Micromonospora sp. NPDC047644]|uniref:hypothetical protein n=1 Tax=Micromonospora sp. NPDC047644 TaxID=3157203 RepID=UPI0034556AB4
MAALAALLAATPAAPASAGAAAPDPERDRIGIQLLEAPVDRRADPRAHTYIIDHLAPGSTISRQIKVVNRSDSRYRLELYPASATVDGGQFRFGEGRTANELSSWTSLDRSTVTLGAGDESELTATISVPKKATAGERYAVIWAAVTSEPKDGGNVTQVHRVGIRVYLDVGAGGEPPSSFAIGAFTAGRTAEGQATLAVAVRNTGGRALDLTGTLALAEGPAGVRAGPFDVVDGTTLGPAQSGSVTVALPPNLPNGPWRADLTLTSGLVKETASATITFPDPGEPASTFGLDDLSMIVGVSLVVGLVLLAGLLLVVRRRRQTPLRAPRLS